PVGDVVVRGGLEVEHDAALVAMPGGVRRRVRSWTAGGIDADHVCALVREQHGRQRPRDVLPEVDHPDAVEYAGHASPPPVAVIVYGLLYVDATNRHPWEERGTRNAE